jgi:peptidoglycan/xylan/chitin deacetylase (PgdA/CDA1 family)
MHTNHKCRFSLDIALDAATSVAAVVMLGPYVYCKLSARSRAANSPRFKALIPTYDDCPGIDLTTMIFGILRGHQASATFLCQGIRASESPDMLDFILSEGHETGCHTYRHHYSWKVWTHVALCDIERGYASLARWIPSDGIFRPPYGKITLFAWLSPRNANPLQFSCSLSQTLVEKVDYHQIQLAWDMNKM